MVHSGKYGAGLCPNETHVNDFQGRPLSQPLRYTLLLVGATALVSGFFGNLLLLLVAWRRRRKRGQCCAFIFNLATADLAVVCSSLPYFLLDLLMGTHPVAGKIHCRFGTRCMN